MKKETDRERSREFLSEAEDILSAMGKDILKLGRGVRAGIIDPAVLNAIFRSAHTLKAISGVFDFMEMARLSHALEDTLDMLRHGRITVSGEVLSSIMKAHDLLVRMAASKGNADFSAEAGRAEAVLNASAMPKAQMPGAHLDGELVSTLTEYEAHRLGENIRSGRNIFIIDAHFPITSFDKNYLAMGEALKPSCELIATLPCPEKDDGSLSFNIYIGTDKDKEHIRNVLKASFNAGVRDMKDFIPARTPKGNAGGTPAAGAPADDAAARGTLIQTMGTHESPVAPPKETLRKQTKTVRVNIKKLEGMMSLVSELGFLRSSLSELSSELKEDRRLSRHGVRLSRIEKRLEKKIGELRDGVLGARMIPVAQLFGRFEPFIERVSRETHKEIRMLTYGDATEIDKLIIEEIADPLMHIVRNVIDHAIEPPMEREAAGKPASGSITLSAYQKGSHAVVEVKDDGRGIDEELLRRKAVERGVLGAEKAHGLSRRETLELIFLPGFTTLDSVSATSGRGVGMDVVKDNISRLSGTIDIETVPGKGTRFILTIPVTLAITDALIVEEGGVRYALPLNSINEIITLDRLPAGACGREGRINVNGRETPSMRLGRFLGRETCKHDSPCCGVVAAGPDHRVCIIVDRLVEELDVIVKPLPWMIKSPGIAGAADLGEKGVVLVLDVAAIIDLSVKYGKNAPELSA